MRRSGTCGLHYRAKGIVLISTALLMVMMIGMLGLCLDLSRMYIAKNELQAFADAASLAAARHLDGTSTGLTYARNTATSYPDQWYFQSAPPDTVTVTFATDPFGPYEENPATPVGVKYVHVEATGSMALYFMPGFSATAPAGAWMFEIAKTQSLTGRATSGEHLINGLGAGVLPYSPDAIDIADPNYGYTVGYQYTLRWPPPGQRKKNSCPGDAAKGYVTSHASAERGFIDLGSGSASFLRQAIVNNEQTHPIYVGDTIVPAYGNKGTESDAMRERFAQDTDLTSSTATDYLDNLQLGLANGRRLAIVPVNNPANDIVLGFGLFLLQSDVCGDKNVTPCCASYISNDPVMPARPGGSGTPGLHALKLFK